MDHQSYGAWERHMVEVLTENAGCPESSLVQLTEDARRLSAWRPGGATLDRAVASIAAERLAVALPPESTHWSRDVSAFRDAVACVVDGHVWADAPADPAETWRRFAAPHWPAFAPVVGRYLAAHAFASWMAYQGSGLVTVVGLVRMAHAILRVEIARYCEQTQRMLDAKALTAAIRRADLLLVHLTDRELLARRLQERNTDCTDFTD